MRHPLEVRLTSGAELESGTGTKRHSGPILRGYAAVFNSMSHDLGFFEVIERGAFSDSLKRREVMALYYHDPLAVLGRTKNGTLRLAEDARGLRFELQLPNTQLGADIAALVERGDLSQMSFGFSVAPNGDSWHREGAKTIRTLKKVNLSEISIVALPAYESTTVALKRALDAVDAAIAAALADRRRRLEELTR